MVNVWKQAGVAFLMLCAAMCSAADKEHGTLIREATLYASPGANSNTLVQVERGSDLVLLERSNADNQTWAKVFVTLQQGQQTRELTGWAPVKAIITPSTANGDQIIFGQAVASEHQAEERGGRKQAAQDAMQLYARVPELFPGSPLAAEAMWRSADIRWQLAKTDFLRSGTQPEEKYLKEVIARFPQSKQAELAAYDLLEAKLCPEWRGMAECPEKESALFEQYAREHPQSAKAAEALYNAAWRQAALADIYRIENEMAKSEAARKKGLVLAQQVAAQYAQGDWKPRAADLVYKLEKKIPVYGQTVE